MSYLAVQEPVDYLVIGHIACDLVPDGSRMGGSAAYAALTARALGLRVGIVTAWDEELPLPVFHNITSVRVPTKHNTTFRNVNTPAGRIQNIINLATSLSYEHIPISWHSSPIIHVAPIAQEINSSILDRLNSQNLYLTPQGWLRKWKDDGLVTPCPIRDTEKILTKVRATIISIEDVGGDEIQIESMVQTSQVVVVTEGYAGARLYWNGDLRRFSAPKVDEIDATGAGDIFAAAFFSRFHATNDPWAAARFATNLSSYSVTREGLESIPTAEEIQQCTVEVL